MRVRVLRLPVARHVEHVQSVSTVYTHTHTHTHTQRERERHTHTHNARHGEHVQSGSRVKLHACTHANIHACMHACKHAKSMQNHACVHACIHGCVVMKKQCVTRGRHDSTHYACAGNIRAQTCTYWHACRHTTDTADHRQTCVVPGHAPSRQHQGTAHAHVYRQWLMCVSVCVCAVRLLRVPVRLRAPVSKS